MIKNPWKCPIPPSHGGDRDSKPLGTAKITGLISQATLINETVKFGPAKSCSTVFYSTGTSGGGSVSGNAWKADPPRLKQGAGQRGGGNTACKEWCFVSRKPFCWNYSGLSVEVVCLL